MTGSEMLDCELYISARDHARFKLEGGGEFSGSPDLSEQSLTKIRGAPDSAAYGRELFRAIFRPGERLEQGFRSAVAISRYRHPASSLRLRIHLWAAAPPELRALCWERLSDPDADSRLSRLACSPDVALSRSLTLDSPVLRPPASPRLLVAVADPQGLKEIYGLQPIEREEAEDCLRRILESSSWLSWEILSGPVTADRINRRLQEGNFHALHLVAHGRIGAGRTAASLFLEESEGGVDLVHEELIPEIVRRKGQLRLVTLMACYGAAPSSDGEPGSREAQDAGPESQRDPSDPFSGLGPALFRAGVPAVLAMQEAISFEAAEEFSRVFYSALAETGEVDVAANHGRQQLFLKFRKSDQWSNPVLYLRLQQGRLLQPRRIRRGSSDVEDIPWRSIVGSLDRGDLLPILGPGLHSRGPEELPLKGELAVRWASEYFDFPLDERRTDLPTVAQFVEFKELENWSRKVLQDRHAQLLLENEEEKTRRDWARLKPTAILRKAAVERFRRDPKDPHCNLASLPFPVYMTTNHDGFLATAIGNEGKELIREWYPEQPPSEGEGDDEEDPAGAGFPGQPSSEGGGAQARYPFLKGRPDHPLLFHLFGVVESPRSLVLTADDHLDFVRRVRVRAFPLQLQRALNKSTLLFLGYDVRELDCRALFRGLMPQIKPRKKSRFAVLQIERSSRDSLKLKALERFLEESCDSLDIKVFWGSVRDFLIELGKRWKKHDAGR